MKRKLPFCTRVANLFSRWLHKPRTEKNYVPNPIHIEMGNWPQISVSKEAKRLRLEARGEEDGHNGVPSTHATQPETVGAHAEIMSIVENRVSKEYAACENLLAHRNRTIVRCKSQIDGIIESLEAAEKRFKEELSQIQREQIPTLSDLDEALESEEKELNDFKKKNRITRPPRAPEERWWKFALLLTAFLGEGLMNMLFFARGSEFGLIGGIIQALIFAGVDGVIVCFLGMGIAWFASRKLWYKLTASFCTTLFAGWAVLYNFLVAHYREAAQKGLEDAPSIAFETFKNNPFSLDQPDSILLVAIGFIISIIGMWTGYTWRDPIPGYEAIGKRYRTQRKYFLSQHNKFLEGIRNAKNSMLRDVDQKVKLATENLMRFTDTIGRIDTIIKNFPKYHTDAEKSGNALIRIYETANEKARSSPPPPFFHSHKPLQAPKGLSGQIGMHRNKLSTYEAQIKSKAGHNRTLKQNIEHFAEQAEEKYRQNRKNYFKSKEARKL